VTRRRLAFHRIARAPYAETHALQERLVLARQKGTIGDTVLLVEHEPVITLGRGAKAENVLATREALAARGVELVEIGRGGDVTYHGPGQLVVYPILDLGPDRKDVRRYVRDLEEAMIRVAARWDVTAERVTGLNGAWVRARGEGEQDGKLGAVGVRISRWVTMHGLAFNVTTELDGFALIVPCGIRGRGVTSLRAETGRDVPMRDVEDAFVEVLAEVFDADVDGGVRDGAPR
jgi:lipoyl(octanoyl) transferase